MVKEPTKLSFFQLLLGNKIPRTTITAKPQLDSGINYTLKNSQ